MVFPPWVAVSSASRLTEIRVRRKLRIPPETLPGWSPASTMRAMPSYETRTRRFSRAEYERLIALGVFQPGEAIELIGGELMVAEPQGAAHYTAIVKTAKALELGFASGAGRPRSWVAG